MPRAWDTEMRVITDETMSGSFSTPWAEGNITNEAFWNISKRLDINPILHKADESWRPKTGDTIDITAEIEKYEEIEGKWRFTLFDVSKEKGYCMNAGDDEGFDLEFVEGQEGFTEPEETDDGWKIETTKTMNEVSVSILALDYGACGRLKAEVNVDGLWYECEAEGGGDSITIPLDENKNYIADTWEEKKEVKGEPATADSDSKPEGMGDEGEPGDGFSNYEEYRGFFVNGSWKDTDPKYKDLFIYDELGLGVGLFTELDLHLHLIDRDEYDNGRVVNFNRNEDKTFPGQSATGQKGLYLRGGSADGNYGSAHVGTPNVCEEVVVDVASIYDSCEFDYKYDVLGNPDPEYPVDQHGAFQSMARSSINVTIAHELGHGVNIMHHGMDASIAERGGKWSGDVRCIMRYEKPGLYYGPDGEIYEYPDEEGEASLTTFCNQKEGTGINTPGERIVDGKPYPVAGNAAWGECRQSVTLKGYEEYGGIFD